MSSKVITHVTGKAIQAIFESVLSATHPHMFLFFLFLLALSRHHVRSTDASLCSFEFSLLPLPGVNMVREL